MNRTLPEVLDGELSVDCDKGPGRFGFFPAFEKVAETEESFASHIKVFMMLI